jgi:hypothetical protein
MVTLVTRLAQTSGEPPPTIDPRPILLLIAVVMIAYVIVTHIKDILIFFAVLTVALVLLGVFHLAEMLQGASAVPPSV